MLCQVFKVTCLDENGCFSLDIFFGLQLIAMAAFHLINPIKICHSCSLLRLFVSCFVGVSFLLYTFCCLLSLVFYSFSELFLDCLDVCNTFFISILFRFRCALFCCSQNAFSINRQFHSFCYMGTKKIYIIVHVFNCDCDQQD